MTVAIRAIPHEWDFPVTGSAQRVGHDRLRVVAWAKCARCGELVAGSADFSEPMVLPASGNLPVNVPQVVNMLGQRMGVLTCRGRPPDPDNGLPGAL